MTFAVQCFMEFVINILLTVQKCMMFACVGCADVFVVLTALMQAKLCVVIMQAVRQHMQLEVNRLKWEHIQEVAEIRHNAG